MDKLNLIRDQSSECKDLETVKGNRSEYSWPEQQNVEEETLFLKARPINRRLEDALLYLRFGSREDRS